MTNSGYIKLHRQIRDNILFQEKRIFSKFEVWVDILLSCNFSQGEFLLGYEIIQVEIGSFITSKTKMILKYGWSKQKLNNFLGLLETLGMIKVKVIGKGNQKATQLFVLNYRKYQIDQPKEVFKKAPKTTLSDTQYKKEKNNISIDILENISTDNKFGDIKINKLQQIIKYEVEKRGLIYETSGQERARLNNILNGKRINKIAFENQMDIFEFVIYIFGLIDQSEFWNGKINSGETLYKYYPKIINEYKTKQKLLYGICDIDSFFEKYNLTETQKEKLIEICEKRKINKQKMNNEIIKNIIYSITLA